MTSVDFESYTSSPSTSSSNTIFSNGQYFDSNSESSNPASPHMNKMTFGASMPYDIHQYNAIPADCHLTWRSDTGSAEVTSSTFEEKSRRRKRTGGPKSDEREATTNMGSRRRAQNRASQRAFRERKEKHVKGLEYQLEDLHEKHQDLLQSYSKQVDEVSRLNAQVADLAAELNTIRRCQDSSTRKVAMSSTFDNFDAFSSTAMIYSATDAYYDKGPTDTDPEFELNCFEDSL